MSKLLLSSILLVLSVPLVHAVIKLEQKKKKADKQQVKKKPEQGIVLSVTTTLKCYNQRDQKSK